MSERPERHITIVAEIGVAWRNLEEAKGMIKNAKECGCDKVKFQVYNEKTVAGAPVALFKQLMEIKLDEAKAQELFDYAKSQEIDWFATPMYPEAVDFLEKVGVARYKIRERDGRALVSEDGSSSPVEPTPLIKRVFETNKPMYISVQRKPLDRFYLYHPRISYLYCKPEYPARLKDLELWKCAYNYGLSCHTPEIIAPVTAAVLMLTHPEDNTAKIIELHVSNEPKSNYPDGNVSFNWDELKQVVTMIRRVEEENVEYPY